MSKQGHKLTLVQKKLLAKNNFDWHEWKFLKEEDEYYVFCSKEERTQDRTYIRIEKK